MQEPFVTGFLCGMSFTFFLFALLLRGKQG